MFEKNILSIDIGSKNIKIVEGRYTGKKVLVSKAHIFDTPKNCFNDGEITNLITMQKELGNFIKEIETKTKKVVVISKSTSVITRNISIPQAKPNEISSLIEYEIRQYLPINFEDYIINYKKVSEYEENGVKMLSVNVAVYPKFMAKNYWDLIKEIKLTPMALDLTSNCTSKVFLPDNLIINNDKYVEDSTIVTIDIGSEQLEVNIMRNGNLEFTRILTGGGAYLEEDESISPKLLIDRWSGEIIRVIDYFKSKDRDRQIDRVYLHGGFSNIEGIEEHMESILKIRTERIYKINKVEFLSKNENTNLERYLNAIGGIIRLK